MGTGVLLRIARGIDKAGKIPIGDSTVGSIEIRPPPAKIEWALRRIVMEAYGRYEPHEKAGRFMQKRIRENIDSARTAEGQKWPPLRHSTIQRRHRDGYFNDEPLQRTGKLRASVRWEVWGVGRGPQRMAPAETVTRISPERLGTRNVKARVQQGKGLGTFIRSGAGGDAKVPSRPYVGMSANDERQVQIYFLDYISEAIAKRTSKLKGA